MDNYNIIVDLIRFYQQARGGNTDELRNVYCKDIDLEKFEENLEL